MISPNPTGDSTTINGTVVGTGFTLLATVDGQDIVKTIVLASLGAVVSFMVSKVLKYVWEKIRKK